MLDGQPLEMCMKYVYIVRLQDELRLYART